MNSDTLIIGSGIAGLSLAIKLAQLKPENQIIVISKTEITEANTAYAQGGVAAVIDKSDSFEKHINDTLEAGHFLNDQKIVELVVKDAPTRLYELIDWGAKFDFKESGKLDLGLEGGHSAHRILHHKDSSGKEIHRTLMDKANNCQNIKILEHLFVIDLLVSNENQKKCEGANCLNYLDGKNISIKSNKIVIATGGIGQIFKHTTNPKLSTGDGIAMAHRAGVKISDMKYVQFHPTALKGNDNPAFLLSEAVRGFGAYLLNEKEERFMVNYHPKLELATRDIVCAAISKELANSESNAVYLDCRHLEQKELEESFPKIYSKLISESINPKTDLIPITPAAHYLCGGIKVDQTGKTSLNNLYACGECAKTGLHGSNRLASNSLLEALVFAHIIAEDIANSKVSFTHVSPERKNEIHAEQKDVTNSKKIEVFVDKLKEIMSELAGVQKTTDSLFLAETQINKLEEQFQVSILHTSSLNYYEALNLFTVAKLIIKDKD